MIFYIADRILEVFYIRSRLELRSTVVHTFTSIKGEFSFWCNVRPVQFMRTAERRKRPRGHFLRGRTDDQREFYAADSPSRQNEIEVGRETTAGGETACWFGETLTCEILLAQK